MAKHKPKPTSPATQSIIDAFNQALDSASGSGSRSKTNGKRRPLGVPQGYSITTPYDPSGIDSLAAGSMAPGDFGGGQGPTVSTGPRYFKGDEWGTADGFPTNPTDLTALQKALIQSGLLKPDNVVFGQWDSSSANAFAELLKTANQGGATWQDTLASRMSAIDQGNALGAAAVRKAPLVIKHVDDNTLSLAFQDTAQKLLGQNMPDAQVNQMISAYHALETANQTAAYNAGDPNVTGVLTGGLGGSANETPAPTDFAQSQVRSQDPTGVAANTFGDMVFQNLQSLSKSGNL